MAGILLLGCKRGAPVVSASCCDKAEGERDDAAVVEATEVGLARIGSAGKPRFRREEGCARDLRLDGGADGDMAELQRLCAQGMLPILPEIAVATALRGANVETPFRVTAAPACLRAAVVADTPGLAMSLVGPAGEVLARATSADAIGVIPVDGTVCVREPGTFNVLVKAADGSEGASVRVQIWQATRD